MLLGRRYENFRARLERNREVVDYNEAEGSCWFPPRGH